MYLSFCDNYTNKRFSNLAVWAVCETDDIVFVSFILRILSLRFLPTPAPAIIYLNPPSSHYSFWPVPPIPPTTHTPYHGPLLSLWIVASARTGISTSLCHSNSHLSSSLWLLPSSRPPTTLPLYFLYPLVYILYPLVYIIVLTFLLIQLKVCGPLFQLSYTFLQSTDLLLSFHHTI
jgi:hypothetical protein